MRLALGFGYALCWQEQQESGRRQFSATVDMAGLLAGGTPAPGSHNGGGTRSVVGRHFSVFTATMDHGGAVGHAV
jgi:hypothetical protein